MFLVAGLAGADAVVSPVQVAVLLQRSPVLRQPAAVRDGPGVREDAAALRLHCDAAAAAGAGEAGEGQTAAGEADSDPHALPEVRECSCGSLFRATLEMDGRLPKPQGQNWRGGGRDPYPRIPLGASWHFQPV